MGKNTRFAIEHRNMPLQDAFAKDEQAQRFIDAGRELGADVPEEDFDRALKRVGGQKPEKSGRRVNKKDHRRD